jgi:hypothetical protein
VLIFNPGIIPNRNQLLAHLVTGEILFLPSSHIHTPFDNQNTTAQEQSLCPYSQYRQNIGYLSLPNLVISVGYFYPTLPIPPLFSLPRKGGFCYFGVNFRLARLKFTPQIKFPRLFIQHYIIRYPGSVVKGIEGTVVANVDEETLIWQKRDPVLFRNIRWLLDGKVDVYRNSATGTFGGIVNLYVFLASR